MNWTHNISGRLWQGRFYSCVLDEDHLWAAIRHVERNPVRARIVQKAENYAWSSAAAHCGLRSDPVPSPLPKGCPVEPIEWSSWLADGDDEKILTTLRLHTRTGRPAGGKRFVTELELRIGRKLRANPVGRPKKKDQKIIE